MTSIVGQGGLFFAISETAGDTNTVQFKIIAVNNDGMVTDVSVCAGSVCIPI
jgi:hypothetical protein